MIYERSRIVGNHNDDSHFHKCPSYNKVDAQHMEDEKLGQIITYHHSFSYQSTPAVLEEVMSCHTK